MEPLAFTFPSLCGAVAAWLVTSKRIRLWITLVTVWLCVPLGLVSSEGLGLWLKNLGNCYDHRGRDVVECLVFGLDITEWVNGLKMGGYAFAFVGLPWFLVGAVLLAIVLLIRILRTNHQ